MKPDIVDLLMEDPTEMHRDAVEVIRTLRQRVIDLQWAMTQQAPQPQAPSRVVVHLDGKELAASPS